LGISGPTATTCSWVRSPSSPATCDALGDDRSEVFTYTGGSYLAPAGSHETLVHNIDGTWTLTTPTQVAYHFLSNMYCDTITDETPTR